jgi:hypothetical protein
MIDALLYSTDRANYDYTVDINIVNGWAEEVPEPQWDNTIQQRKAALAYQQYQSIPGDWERGVDWSDILKDPKGKIADAIMQTQVATGADAGGSSSSYAVPIITPTPQGPRVQVLVMSAGNASQVAKELSNG